METPQTVPPTPAADSSPAPVSAQSYLDRMDAAERTQWELSGEFPERLTKADANADPSTQASDVSADPSSAEPAAQAPPTDGKSTAPASEPGTPADKKTKRPRNADTRVEELLADRAQARAEAESLRRRLEALERRPQSHDQPGSDPAAAPTTKAEWERYVAMPEAPKLADFESIDAHAAAMALFITDHRWQEHESRQRQTESQRQRLTEFDQVTSAAAERIRKATEADPEFRAKVDDRLLDVPPVSALPPGQKPTPHNVLAEEILRSDITDRLLLHFSTEQGQQDWQRLTASRSHADFLRAFGRLEAGLSGAASAAPQPKHVSSAPEPARTLGNRGADGGDALVRAVKEGDFSRFERLANERELAAR